MSSQTAAASFQLSAGNRTQANFSFFLRGIFFPSPLSRLLGRPGIQCDSFNGGKYEHNHGLNNGGSNWTGLSVRAGKSFFWEIHKYYDTEFHKGKILSIA